MIKLNYLSAILTISFLAACAGGGDGNNSRPSTTSISNTRGLFSARCASCHGADGTAGLGGATNLQTSRMDSTNVLTTLMTGRRAMPSFKGQLSEAELRRLAGYVVGMHK